MPFPFPFTFSLSVPGISNPFQPSPFHPRQFNHQTGDGVGPSTMKVGRGRDMAGDEDELNLVSRQSKDSNTRRRASPNPVDLGNPRKRGWEPAFAGEPSLGPSYVTVSHGYLDTPAQLAKKNQEEHDAREQVLDELQQPPAKRRRTLAGSIVSTAVNAALVGTAVGLTVYRLWRDRGSGKKLEQQQITNEPPPPYSPPSPDVHVIPPTPRITRKTRRTHEVRSTRRRPARKVMHNTSSLGPSASTSQSALFPPVQSAFDFSSSSCSAFAASTSSHSSHSSPRRNRESDSVFSDRTEGPTSFAGPDDFGPDPDDEMDQIDSLGSKLSFLIEQGKRALGREIVVMSEVEEDEVDDGSGAWVEDEGDDGGGEFGKKGQGRAHRGRLSRSGSTSRRRAAGGAPFAGSSTGTGSVGRRAGADMSISLPPYGLGMETRSRGPSVPSSPPASVPTFETSWESEELKETMERARAIVRERRSMNFRSETVA
ncbi:hypothetical protein FB446DRAFT_742941 [Lentinula raphanica]|nr:hypothetical protein FB446DRAFT_742941 [Lentinula raphanica]